MLTHIELLSQTRKRGGNEETTSYQNKPYATRVTTLLLKQQAAFIVCLDKVNCFMHHHK